MSDYAGKIASDIVDREIQTLTLQYGNVRSWQTVEILLAQAAREGYALGYGAAHGHPPLPH